MRRFININYQPSIESQSSNSFNSNQKPGHCHGENVLWVLNAEMSFDNPVLSRHIFCIITFLAPHESMFSFLPAYPMHLWMDARLCLDGEWRTGVSNLRDVMLERRERKKDVDSSSPFLPGRPSLFCLQIFQTILSLSAAATRFTRCRNHSWESWVMIHQLISNRYSTIYSTVLLPLAF